MRQDFDEQLEAAEPQSAPVQDDLAGEPTSPVSTLAKATYTAWQQSKLAPAHELFLLLAFLICMFGVGVGEFPGTLH